MYRGISYTLFFAIFGNLIRWSYGYQLLKKRDDDDNSTIADEEVVPVISTYHSFDNNNASGITIQSTGSGSSSDSDDSDYLSTNPNNKKKRDGMPSRQLSAVTIKVVDESSSLLPQTQKLGGSKQLHNDISTGSSADDHILKIIAKKINGFMSPPLYAAFLALAVGLSPLKPLLYDKDSFLYPSFTKAIEGCGKAAVPLILTCLGAQLVSIADSQQPASPQMKKPVATAIAIRMCLMPFLVVPIVILFVLYGARFSTLAGDPVFITMMIVLGCTPTAINLVQITQVNNIFEEEMLRMLFWSYGVVCVPVCTFTVFLALNVVDRML